MSLDPRTLRRTPRLRDKRYARYAGIPNLPSLRFVEVSRIRRAELRQILPDHGAAEGA